MHLIIYIILIILFKQIINNYFSKKIDTHSLFRSFFCFFISTLSIFFSINNWNNLLIKPLESTNLSIIINQLMLAYMLVDTFYYCLILNKNIRKELILHHIICICLYGIFYDKLVMSFCSLGEILSAFNWIGIIYPKYEWTIKLFRLYSILFIRFFVWTFTLVFLYKYTYLFWLGLVGVITFICFDCYWIYIILLNYIKYKSFIKNKIMYETKKIVSYQSKKINKISNNLKKKNFPN